ncbi:MAG: APC family permease [Candidatus Dormibacteraeota bacterium]|uniref:APC family permease n=1 Tax=Candidatus Amunia macphersoniae TaxID=3127014 RepID=A0A934NGD0_9BACT|nr:APC family permease [Candidatus Dormibacteraeota bacterium]
MTQTKTTRGPDPVSASGPGVLTATGANQLARGTLTTWDAVAISVSVLAPGMAMFLNVPGVAAVAGGSTPLSFLLGGVGILALAFVVIGFTRRMASAGYAYTYASRSIGKEGGFVAGWLYAFGLSCFVPMTMAGTAALAVNLLGLDPKLWFLFFLIGMALLVTLSIIAIRVTTRVQLLVGAITVAVIVVVDVITTAKGGAGGNTVQPFTFGHTISGGFNGVFYGIILGVTSYIGFETAADFGEETDNPRRSIPIAIIAATGFAIVFYLFTTYAMTVGFGVDNAAFGSDAFALKTVAKNFVGGPFPQLVEIGGMLSAFIVCLACATAAARTLFAMGREGVMPRWFGKTNARFRTPANATLTVAGISTVLAALVGYLWSQDAFGGAPQTVYFFFATLGTLGVILVYIMLCLGGMAFFRRTKASYNVLLHAVVPLIGAVIFGAAFYGSVYPQPPFPLNLTPYITAAWLVIGIVAVVVLRSQNPAAVERIGSILGEEGGEDAKLLSA